MKLRLALVAALALPVGLAAMPTAVEYLPSKIAIRQAVKLGDGSVLPAGAYDVQIHYKGFGNAAEFHFFLGGAFKGKTNAEARGFPSQAPAGAADANTLQHTVKLNPGTIAEDKHAPAPSDDKQKGNSAAKVFPKVEQAGPATHAFSWEKAGFRAGLQGIAAPGGPGMLKLSFNSSDSAAGFSAILPYVEKARK